MISYLHAIFLRVKGKGKRGKGKGERREGGREGDMVNYAKFCVHVMNAIIIHMYTYLQTGCENDQFIPLTYLMAGNTIMYSCTHTR